MGWRSPGESGGQILLYINFISDILAWRRGGEESSGIMWSDNPVYLLYFRYISLEERGGGVQGNHVVRYSSIFTQQREEFIHKISWQTDLAKENIKSIKTRILTFQNYCFKIG